MSEYTKNTHDLLILMVKPTLEIFKLETKTSINLLYET